MNDPTDRKPKRLRWPGISTIVIKDVDGGLIRRTPKPSPMGGMGYAVPDCLLRRLRGERWKRSISQR